MKLEMRNSLFGRLKEKRIILRELHYSFQILIRALLSKITGKTFVLGKLTFSLILIQFIDKGSSLKYYSFKKKGPRT